MFGCDDAEMCSSFNFLLMIVFFGIWMARTAAQNRRLDRLEMGLSARPEIKTPVGEPLVPCDAPSLMAPVVNPSAPYVVPSVSPVEKLSSPQSERPLPSSIESPVKKPVNWEQWIGVRGAAVGGAVVLALAGLMFFKYSIENGLISPVLRVILATLAGLACIALSETVLRRRYEISANATAGAALVILYAAFWAAKTLYGFIGIEAATVLMVLVTTTGGLLAVRHGSMLIAMLGIVGGFLTPLLLSSGQDNPIGLFGYLLLLDVGVFLVARKKGWRILAVLSLVATALYQFLWIGTRMGPDRIVLALVILGVFALAFAGFGRFSGSKKSGDWFGLQTAALLLPFAFSLYFAGNADLGLHLYPIGILMTVLSATALWVARAQKQPLLGIGIASAAVAVVMVWLMRCNFTAHLEWETVAVCFVLALTFHLFVEFEPSVPVHKGAAVAAMVAGLGLMFLLVLSVAKPTAFFPWPLIAGWIGFAGLMMRHAVFEGRARLFVAAAAGVGLGLAFTHWVFGLTEHFLPFSLFLALVVSIGVGFQLVALLLSGEQTKKWAEHAAALFPLIFLASLIVSPSLSEWEGTLVFFASVVLGVLVALASTRGAAGGWFLGAAIAVSSVQTAWVENRTVSTFSHEFLWMLLAWQVASVAFFVLWPFGTAYRFARSRWAWYGAALAGPLWFVSMRELYLAAFGNSTIGVVPVLLGAASLMCAFKSQTLSVLDRPMAKTTLVWFSAIALGFVSVAIPLQLDKQWITMGWALEGAAVLLLWKRLDHPGLKYFGLLLFGAVFVRLVVNPALLEYYPRPSWRIINWITYTYLVPAVCMISGVLALRKNEPLWARSWETIYKKGVAWGAGISGLAAMAVVFKWINLMIADWFSTGSTLVVSWDRMPARDVATSVSWGLYSLVILSVGVVGKIKALRWLSLGLLLITVGKVFLYDLGSLRDLYRVISLVGLALSLMLVSLAYQRFVFRDAPKKEATNG